MVGCLRYKCLNSIAPFFLFCVVFLNEHAETLVMVHFWVDVIYITRMQSVGVPIGGVFMNEY